MKRCVCVVVMCKYVFTVCMPVHSYAQCTRVCVPVSKLCYDVPPELSYGTNRKHDDL